MILINSAMESENAKFNSTVNHDYLKSLDKDELLKIDLEYLSKLGFKNQGYLTDPAGAEPYQLLAYMSQQYTDSIILDIGSFYGNSALALSHNDNNKVISYDIIDHGQTGIKKDNIEWKVIDFRNDDSIDYSKVVAISLDVDPHDGVKEPEMINFLKEKGWSGPIILDDINLSSNMKEFWESLEDYKLDITSYGHMTGTGLLML